MMLESDIPSFHLIENKGPVSQQIHTFRTDKVRSEFSRGQLSDLSRRAKACQTDPRTRLLALACLLIVSFLCAAPRALAQGDRSSGPELKFVVILSRHGIRSPTWSAERLNQYSAEPWPDWGVPPGYLTPHGETLMKLVGAYDRAYLAQAGLLSAAGCSDAARVFLWTDSEERTLETGRALAAGLLPGCSVQVHSLPPGKHDPLFSPFGAGIQPPDGRTARAAITGRIGGNPAALEELCRPELEAMQRVLLVCKPESPCPAPGDPPRKSLFATPTSLGPGKGDHSAELSGPLKIASSFSEDFLLEYTDGMAGANLGWGRLTESGVRHMMRLHAVYADLMRQTPFVARARASNLLSHILKTLQQAAEGRPVPGALGNPGGRVVILVGHDTNISNIAGALGLSWLIAGYQRDDTPPGGALVFELWRQPADGTFSVRTYYTCQTLDQMHRALPLTLDSPPARSPIFVPGCSTAGEGMPCGWKAFRRTVAAAIDPEFIAKP
jgi:4-phytase/acid phosphatase